MKNDEGGRRAELILPAETKSATLSRGHVDRRASREGGWLPDVVSARHEHLDICPFVCLGDSVRPSVQLQSGLRSSIDRFVSRHH